MVPTPRNREGYPLDGRTPTAEWTARQVIEAVGLDGTPKYLVRDRDRKFGTFFSRQIESVRLSEVLTAPASPWQNAYAERVIGTIRRECMDHTIILGERHLRRIVQRYVGHYNGVRTHMSLAKDPPRTRPVQLPHIGTIQTRRHCGGLHHEYYRQAAQDEFIGGTVDFPTPPFCPHKRMIMLSSAYTPSAKANDMSR